MGRFAKGWRQLKEEGRSIRKVFICKCPMQGDEMNEFLGNVYVPRLFELIKHYFHLRMVLPKIHIEWKNEREVEVVKLNERIELSANPVLIKKDPKKFSRSFFEKKYAKQGGTSKLEDMIRRNLGPSEIGEWFGFSKQRASDILQSYQFGKIVAVLLLAVGIANEVMNYADFLA